MKLLPLEKEHLEFLRSLRNDPVMNDHLFSPNIPISQREQELWYEGQIADKRNHIFIACVEGIDAPVGYGQVKNIDYFNRSVELGFHIAPEYQNNGYGTALIKGLVEFASGTLNMHRIYLEAFAKNKKAVRLYEKCGFVEEGILRDKVLKNGRFEDVIVMSIITEDSK